ncbi:MAG TPA: NAD(P)-dependent oxidoreductase [Stellaceae bacterium]|nr:NAD(P)-dependent oxidoreductase [Stellaceae bacterium]
MRILLTGASSFTGFWFAKALAEAGHEVWASLASADEGAYSGVRGTRLALLQEFCRTVFGAPFGSDNFFATLREAKPDRLCHHWADVRDYQNPDFDVVAALAANTRRLVAVLRAMRDMGCGGFVLTDSVFEPEEGIGNPPLRAFSPYGLSKGLTRRLVEYYCGREGVALDRFVIANPFGPYEEPRFTDYLMKTWMKGGTARVATPRYVRDNVPADLLAKAYAAFVKQDCGGRRFGLSCYAETQGAFAERVAREARSRLELLCALEFGEQSEFREPEIRLNTDLPDRTALGWSEAGAWDAFVRYYEGLYAR